MSTAGFSFESGNLGKLIAIPKYALSWLISLVVPRSRHRWVFGSGIGVGEGPLALALKVQKTEPGASITWITSDGELGEVERDAALSHGFHAARRRSVVGYWASLRARTIVVSHGLGDANRFGVFGARVVHLGHGVPVKKLHLDSPVTTSVRGPAPLRKLLRVMYELASRQVDLYVAGSVTAAERLRSAYRVVPGLVRVLGDARDDELALQSEDLDRQAGARAAMREMLGLPAEVDNGASEPLILYAPTWRDGAADPAVPTADEAAELHRVSAELGARLVIRSHPLGAGSYEPVLGDRVHLLGSDLVRDVTPLLGAFDVVITDYSSIAIDFSLLSRPIIWFAPDLEEYRRTRGLYEPLEVTARGRIERSWGSVASRLQQLFEPGGASRIVAEADARALSERFHERADGDAAGRVLAVIKQLDQPARKLVAPDSVYFESFYGRQVSCNPFALDREIATRHPELKRYWSVTSERIRVPNGATPVLVGGPEWKAVRRTAKLLVVNDWLRFDFRRRRGQTVLQTWHGTMLKHLALGRPDVGLRTSLAIRRESRRWSLLISQNPHSTEQFRRSYAYRGEILETGYPRDDRLARSIVPAREHGVSERIPGVIEAARRALGVPRGVRVLAYVPTWRENGLAEAGPLLDVARLAAELGEEWVIVLRGHTRSRGFGGSAVGTSGTDVAASATVVDATDHADVNDVILAADLLVTDYSSVMFDAAVARVPMAFFVPDLEQYRERERGFTFDFEASAPGPTCSELTELVRVVHAGVEVDDRYAAWRERFLPHEDGNASRRVVDDLEKRGVLHS